MRARGFIVFALLIMVYSCTFRPPVDGTISNLPLDTFDGLKVSFLPGAPPDEIFSSDAFGIYLDIENAGERTLTKDDMKFFILGINPATFNLNGGEDSFDLSGELGDNSLRGSEIIGNRLVLGDRIVKGFSDISYGGSAIVSEQLFTLSVLACYHYSSQTSFKVCLNKGILREALNSRVCESEGVKQLTPSRSPVKIVLAEQIPSSDAKIRVRLVVQNLGGGTVLFSESGDFELNRCIDVQRGEQNRVRISGELEAGDPIKFNCSPQQVFLIDGAGEVICTAELPQGEGGIGRGNYEVVAKFDLDYSYAQAVEKNLLVVGEIDFNEEETVAQGGSPVTSPTRELQLSE